MRKYKVVLLGESGVGKSSLVVRLTKDEYLPNTHSTVGASFSRYAVTVEDGTTVNFDLWDTAGQERYKSLASMYYRGSAAALVVYDITAPESFKRACYWIEEVAAQSGDTLVALVGNKTDLEENRCVSKEEARTFAADRGLIHVEASAKDGNGVREVFQEIARRLVASRTASQQTVAPGGVVNAAGQRQTAKGSKKDKKDSKCC